MRRLQKTAGANLPVLVFAKELAQLDVVDVQALVLEVAVIVAGEDVAATALGLVTRLALLIVTPIVLMLAHWFASSPVYLIAKGLVLAVA